MAGARRGGILPPRPDGTFRTNTSSTLLRFRPTLPSVVRASGAGCRRRRLGKTPASLTYRACGPRAVAMVASDTFSSMVVLTNATCRRSVASASTSRPVMQSARWWEDAATTGNARCHRVGNGTENASRATRASEQTAGRAARRAGPQACTCLSGGGSPHLRGRSRPTTGSTVTLDVLRRNRLINHRTCQSSGGQPSPICRLTECCDARWVHRSTAG